MNDPVSGGAAIVAIAPKPGVGMVEVPVGDVMTLQLYLHPGSDGYPNIRRSVFTFVVPSEMAIHDETAPVVDGMTHTVEAFSHEPNRKSVVIHHRGKAVPADGLVGRVRVQALRSVSQCALKLTDVTLEASVNDALRTFSVDEVEGGDLWVHIPNRGVRAAMLVGNIRPPIRSARD